MARASDTQIKFQIKAIIAILGLVVLGLVFLVLSLKLNEGFWASLLNQLSTALLVGGIWTGVYELFMRNDFVRMIIEQTHMILRRIKLAEGEEDLGLVEVHHDSGEYDYGPLLLSAPELTILLNDGRTWVSTHSEQLRTRFANSSLQTTVFVLHPDSSMLEVLARKVSSSRESLRVKVGETVQMLNSLTIKESRLEILGHQLFNPQSVFLSSDTALVTMYFTARGRRTVPLFKFKGDSPKSFVHKLHEDMRDLRNDSKSIREYDFAAPLSSSAVPPAPSSSAA